jgi:hypothetical protein
MTTLHRLRSTATSWKSAVLGSSGVFLRDIGHGLLEVGHNSLALLGLTVIGIALLPAAAPTSAMPWRHKP